MPPRPTSKKWSWSGPGTPEHLGSSPRPGESRSAYHIGIATACDVPEGQRDPGGGRALAQFHRLGARLTTGRNASPMDHSMLVLWGHAYDFAFGRAQRSRGTIDALDFAELRRAFWNGFKQRFGAPERKTRHPRLRCVRSRDRRNGVPASAVCELPPRFADWHSDSGWPYDRILDRLQNPKDRLMVPAELGSYVVRRFCESYKALNAPVSLTLLDLVAARELSAHAELLALTLASAIGEPTPADRIAELFSRSQTGERKTIRRRGGSVPQPGTRKRRRTRHRGGKGAGRLPG